MNATGNTEILITRDELCALLRISDMTRQRLERSDQHFPPKLRISARRVAYRKADALRYIDRKIGCATA